MQLKRTQKVNGVVALDSVAVAVSDGVPLDWDVAVSATDSLVMDMVLDTALDSLVTDMDGVLQSMVVADLDTQSLEAESLLLRDTRQPQLTALELVPVTEESATSKKDEEYQQYYSLG